MKCSNIEVAQGARCFGKREMKMQANGTAGGTRGRVESSVEGRGRRNDNTSRTGVPYPVGRDLIGSHRDEEVA